jgi:glycosyltransferase involved in cell wall biosynthesis
MKVLIVTPYFYPHPGGVESYSFNIAKQLLRAGWEVVVVTTSIDDLPLKQTIEGIKVYRLKKTFSLSNTPIGFTWRSQFKKIYAQEKPDVINGHVPVPFFADLAERCRGSIPFVLTYHNDLTKDHPIQNLLARLVNRLVVKRTLRRSNHIIATSKHYVDTSLILRPYAEKTAVVSPGVDTRAFNLQVKSVALTSKYRGERVILFVGSINMSQQHKGLDVLIESFARLRSKRGFADTRLVVVGAGDGASMYAKQAEELHVREYIEFAGYIADGLLAQYFKRADVFAMPSKDSNEGFGMVFMEAAAVGTPAVGTNVGGIPYAIQQDVTGLIVRPDDVTALTRALKTILSDAKLAKRFGDAGAKRAASEFDWSILGKRTVGILIHAAKPTVVQIAGYYPPSLGGMERVAEALADELAARDYPVEVLTSNVNQPANPKPEAVPNLRVRRFWAFEFAHTPFAPGFIPALFKIPKHSVMHLHLAQAFYPEWTLLVSKVRRIPYVVHFHLDLQPSGPLGMLFVPYKAIIIKAVIRNAKAVIVFSKEQQRFIHNTYNVPLQKIAIIPNGVGAEYYLTRQKITKRAIYSLLYVGRIASQKRVHFLTEALSLMHEPAQLTIVGDGEDRAAIEQAIPKNISSRITFTGQLSPAETLPYFKKADVFVMASKVEGMPLAILEAMASGLPVVGASVPGIKELVSGFGVVVKDPSATSFAKNLDDLLAHPAKLEELSRKSSAQAKQYSWSALVDRLEQLYKDVNR